MTKAPCPAHFTEWSLNESHIRRGLSADSAAFNLRDSNR